jgi:hypothetical protein
MVIGLLGGAAWPLAAVAQQPATPAVIPADANAAVGSSGP